MMCWLGLGPAWRGLQLRSGSGQAQAVNQGGATAFECTYGIQVFIRENLKREFFVIINNNLIIIENQQKFGHI
jgi:hypothetical protein